MEVRGLSIVILLTVETRGVTRGARGTQFPGRRSLCGRWKADHYATMSQVLSYILYICFRKTSVSNMRAPNWLLAPGAI